MKVSENFDVREFVSKALWDKYGTNSTWFINPKIVDVAEFYRCFFFNHYKALYPNLVRVAIVVNNWHTGGTKQWSGLRTPDYKEGATLSQHRFKDAFDCEIFLVFSDGSRVEVDYIHIHQIIKANEALFLAQGISAIEDVAIAATWLHTDLRWIPGQTKLFFVKP